MDDHENMTKLSSSQDAIKLAIEGGWKKEDSPVFEVGDIKDIYWVRFEREIDQRQIPTIFPDSILLDPLFWQALGKARGWEKCGACDGSGACIDVACWACRATGKWPDGWKDYASNWFHTRMNNGSESDFWESLP